MRQDGRISRDDLDGTRAMQAEAEISSARADERSRQALEFGLESAASIRDRKIPLFNRSRWGFANSGFFMSSPFLADMRELGGQDVAIMGVPLDTGTTFRSGTRFGPQAMRQSSSGSYNPSLGIDLGESLTIVDVGDVSVIPANIEKSFDQIALAVGYIHERGVFPVVLGGGSLDRLSRHSRPGALRRRQHRHHPFRPPFRPERIQPRRADARHALFPRHEHSERAAVESGPDRHRRLDRQPQRRQKRA